MTQHDRTRRRRKNNRAAAGGDRPRIPDLNEAPGHLISIARMQEHAGVEVSAIAFRGAVRPNTTDGFRAFLEQAGARSPWLVVNLSELEYLSSTGIGLLLDQARVQADQGGWLRLVAPSPVVKMILGLSGAAGILTAVDTEAEALSGLGTKAA